MFENMTQREKILATVVGALVPVVFLFMTFMWYLGKLEQNDRDLATARRSLATEIDIYDNAQLAKQRQRYYKELSLPSDTNYAKLGFKTWLIDAVESSGLELTSHSPTTGGAIKSKTSRGKIGQVVPRNLTMNGTLDQMVEFLHKFYSLGAIKRISKLTMTPTTIGAKGKKKVRSGRFKFTMTVEAVSLMSAAKEKPIGEFPIELPKSLEEYRSVISQRNIFSPANNSPSFDVRDKSYYEGEEIAFAVDAVDADDHDELAFELVSPVLEGATINAEPGTRRGSFVCPPQEIGEYEIGIRVFDNGNPSKEFVQQVKFVVEKKPNKFPAIATRSFDVSVGETIELEIEATDPDGDPVTMELVNKDDFPDATFRMDGENRAIFSHPPLEETGRKRFEIKLDDGKEPRMRRGEPVDNLANVSVNIKPPKFLTAEHTRLTSINMIDGVEQAWIDVRPEDVTHVVKAGDSFELDRQKWVVKSVSVKEKLVVFDVENVIRTFQFPCFLSEPLENPRDDAKVDDTKVNVRKEATSDDVPPMPDDESR